MIPFPANLPPILRYFNAEHLPLKLAAVAQPFQALALALTVLPEGAERATALRKLLEAKDAAVRAALDMEGVPGLPSGTPTLEAGASS